ncbi:MAG: HIT domain-containing protein [Nitrospirae bacterium]|nr:HIT domain-containing protein [Nitrospirota bacterium]
MRSNIENGYYEERKCNFCAIEPTRILLSNKHAVAVLDGFPISLGHTLIIPRRHIVTLERRKNY